MTTIRTLEELSLNALPSEQTIHYDGWLLRITPGAGGYPRRANSVQMLYPSLLPLDEKIGFCEAQYGGRGFKTVFKMTDTAPEGLEAALKARGYVLDCTTCIQTLDLADGLPAPDQALIELRVSEHWFADLCRFNDYHGARAAAMRTILERLPVETAFMRVERDGESAALGLGVLERGWLGLYDIVTAPPFRRQGMGRQIVERLLGWGKACGAHNAYLQVVATNAPALRLYESFGFREQYRYWYSQK